MSSVNKVDNSKTHINTRYNNIKYSGYVSTFSMLACCLSGIKKIKIPQKHNIHKFSGIIALFSTIWHLGAIKHWDKFFKNQAK